MAVDVVLFSSGNAPVAQGNSVVGLNLFGSKNIFYKVEPEYTKNPDLPSVSGEYTDRFTHITYYST